MVNLPFSPGGILGCYQFVVGGIHVIIFSLQTVENLQGLDKFLYWNVSLKEAKIWNWLWGKSQRTTQSYNMCTVPVFILYLSAVWEDGILQLKPVEMYGSRWRQLFQAFFTEVAAGRGHSISTSVCINVSETPHAHEVVFILSFPYFASQSLSWLTWASSKS